MWAITLFTPTYPLLASRATCECVRVAGEETIRYTHEPTVLPHWSVEFDGRGQRSLVRHWFRNESANSRHCGE